LRVQSHKGPYEVAFGDVAMIRPSLAEGAHVLIDAKVARLHGERLRPLLAGASVREIEAVESNKSLEALPALVAHLVERGVRRNHPLVAIGGGIVQDITCFLAATMLRGLEWRFVPTTLLAQADSCIGSKSSINCGGAKNILGTFTPPAQVVIDTAFLDTLADADLRSGLGEILKVHAIAGPEAFDRVAAELPRLSSDRALLVGRIRDALEIKRRFIEEDEFDRGPRLVFNYGHSFGHAIEAATDFAIPHGIAVTIGMDMANWLSWRLGRNDGAPYVRMHRTLAANYAPFAAHPVPLEPMIAALGKDKKNTGSGAATVILPDAAGRVERVRVALDAPFIDLCRAFLAEGRDGATLT
jgi:3-dehydroquinate synthase